jgi:hypothetical protein
MNTIVEALTRNLDKIVDRLTGRAAAESTERWMGLLMQAIPVVQQMFETRRSPAAAEGVRERQVRAEFEAEHAVLEREFAEKHARLVASFGPRFVEARLADRGDERDRRFAAAAEAGEVRAAA